MLEAEAVMLKLGGLSPADDLWFTKDAPVSLYLHTPANISVMLALWAFRKVVWVWAPALFLFCDSLTARGYEHLGTGNKESSVVWTVWGIAGGRAAFDGEGRMER